MKTAKILRLSTRIECVQCGASGRAGCDCGVGYAPAGTRAAAAIAKNPEKSDRAIAAEIGADKNVVSRQRKKLTGAGAPVEKRIGRDGKARRLPPKSIRPKALPLAADPIDEECVDCVSEEDRWQRSAANFFGDVLSFQAYWDREFGPEWRQFHRPSELIALAGQAAEEFKKLIKAFKH